MSSLVITSQADCKKALVTITHVENNQVVLGTGFFINGPNDNYRYILTCAHCIINYHNIDQDTITYATELHPSISLSVFVHYPDNKTFTGEDVEVVGYDLFLDCALLRIPQVDFTKHQQFSQTLELGDQTNTEYFQDGIPVYSVIYNYLSDTLSFCKGVVLNKSTQFGSSVHPDCFLSDLPMQAGNSGSPVMVNGNVVMGIVSFLFPSNSTIQETSAVGIRLIKYVVNYYFQRMNTTRLPIMYPIYSLGIDYTFVSAYTPLSYFNSNQGALVSNVYSAHIVENPSNNLQVGDVITTVNGLPVRGNIAEIMYKLGNGISHIDHLKLISPPDNPTTRISGQFTVPSGMFAGSYSVVVNIGFAGSSISGNVVITSVTSSTTTNNTNSEETKGENTTTTNEDTTTTVFTYNVKGTATPTSLHEEIQVEDGAIVVTGTILLDFDVVAEEDNLNDLCFVGILNITNNVFTGQSLTPSPFKIRNSSYVKDDSFNVLINNFTVSGSLKSTLTSLPDLSDDQVTVEGVRLITDANNNESVASFSMVVNSCDWVFDKTSYIPTTRYSTSKSVGNFKGSFQSSVSGSSTKTILKSRPEFIFGDTGTLDVATQLKLNTFLATMSNYQICGEGCAIYSFYPSGNFNYNCPRATIVQHVAFVPGLGFVFMAAVVDPNSAQCYLYMVLEDNTQARFFPINRDLYTPDSTTITNLKTMTRFIFDSANEISYPSHLPKLVFDPSKWNNGYTLANNVLKVINLTKYNINIDIKPAGTIMNITVPVSFVKYDFEANDIILCGVYVNYRFGYNNFSYYNYTCVIFMQLNNPRNARVFPYSYTYLNSLINEADFQHYGQYFDYEPIDKIYLTLSLFANYSISWNRVIPYSSFQDEETAVNGPNLNQTRLNLQNNQPYYLQANNMGNLASNINDPLSYQLYGDWINKDANNQIQHVAYVPTIHQFVLMAVVVSPGSQTYLKMVSFDNNQARYLACNATDVASQLFDPTKWNNGYNNSDSHYKIIKPSDYEIYGPLNATTRADFVIYEPEVQQAVLMAIDSSRYLRMVTLDGLQSKIGSLPSQPNDTYPVVTRELRVTMTYVGDIGPLSASTTSRQAYSFGKWQEDTEIKEVNSIFGSTRYVTGKVHYQNADHKLRYSEMPPLVPLTSFTVTATSGNSPLTVTCQDTSTNAPYLWLWKFGNGVTSRLQNPEPVVYTTKGSYKIQLTTTNAYGSSTSSQVIYVDILPVSSFWFNKYVYWNIPLTVNYIDKSIAATSWLWNFGNGITSRLQNPGPVTYTTKGTYTISLTVTNALGSRSSSQIVYAGVPPVASFTVSTLTGNYPLTVQFTNTSLNVDITTKFLWDFGNGQTSGQENPQVTYYIGGNYKVRLTATNNSGSTSATSETIKAITRASFGYIVGSAKFNNSLYVNFNRLDTIPNLTHYNFFNGETVVYDLICTWNIEGLDPFITTNYNEASAYIPAGKHVVILTITDPYKSDYSFSIRGIITVQDGATGWFGNSGNYRLSNEALLGNYGSEGEHN